MFYLVRTNSDGLLATALPYKFTSRAEAEAEAPVILMGRKQGNGGPILLVQAVAAVDFKASVTFNDVK